MSYVVAFAEWTRDVADGMWAVFWANPLFYLALTVLLVFVVLWPLVLLRRHSPLQWKDFITLQPKGNAMGRRARKARKKELQRLLADRIGAVLVDLYTDGLISKEEMNTLGYQHARAFNYTELYYRRINVYPNPDVVKGEILEKGDPVIRKSRVMSKKVAPVPLPDANHKEVSETPRKSKLSGFFSKKPA